MLNIKITDIRYIVEYWERDSLDIDDNQHILFVLPASQCIDITVTKENIEEINHFFSAISQTSNEKLKITLDARMDFFDRVIYPTRFYGEKFYKYKYGKIINSILKTFGLGIPLVVCQKWRS